MFKYYKENKMITLNRGETAKFNIVLPVKDQNGYIMYSDGTNAYWYDSSKKTLYDAEYKKSKVSLNELERQIYTFKDGDIIRFKVFNSNNCEDVKIQKEFNAEQDSKKVCISLTSEDTTIDDYINQPTDYWYEVELERDNEITTIIGYDENNAKIFRLYPEGGIKS